MKHTKEEIKAMEDLVADFQRLDNERLELNRQVSTMEKRLKEMKGTILKFVGSSEEKENFVHKQAVFNKLGKYVIVQELTVSPVPATTRNTLSLKVAEGA